MDINQKVVETINKGEIHIVEPDLDQVVSDAVKKGYLKASTQAVEANVYLIVVPTPFKENHEPDISFVEAATKVIIPLYEGRRFIYHRIHFSDWNYRKDAKSDPYRAS